MKKMLFKTSLLLSLVSLLVLADTGHATKLLHRNLKGLVTFSKRIFMGTCVSIREGALEQKNGKLYYTEYTFEVSERFKGDVAETITFRQFGMITPKPIDETTAVFQRVSAMPIYRQDQEYMLFLIGDSRLGLTSPVGLHQGAFLIQEDEYGARMIANGLLNRGLFKDISSTEMDQIGLTRHEKNLGTFKSGPFDLDDFSSIVKKMIQKVD